MKWEVGEKKRVEERKERKEGELYREGRRGSKVKKAILERPGEDSSEHLLSVGEELATMSVADLERFINTFLYIQVRCGNDNLITESTL